MGGHVSKKNLALLLGLTLGLASCTNGDAKPKIVFKEPPKAGVLAKIGGKELSLEQLVGEDQISYYETQKKEYEFLMDRIHRNMETILIGAEAKKENLSVDDFIEKKIIAGKGKPSKSDVENFIKEKKIPKAQLNDSIRGRIKDYLSQKKKADLVEAYVAKLTKNNPVEVYIQKPKLNVKVDIGKSPVWGGKDAKVTIVEYSDFQCPFCSRALDSLEKIKKKYGKKVKIAFKHFPLPMHGQAKPASEASMCVHEQNADKFWAYHDILFENQRKLSPEDLVKYATKVGVDTKKFEECVKSKKFASFVENDLKAGETLGIRSTPTFLVNGNLVSGAQPFEVFKEIIDAELK
ncbi:MAG: hypothetical protein CL678_18745 [Bdellovibrionaceae bacterium]|nr:hypothetical protein [Pseudobdellovibrionaceae bacterium]